MYKFCSVLLVKLRIDDAVDAGELNFFIGTYFLV